MTDKKIKLGTSAFIVPILFICGDITGAQIFSAALLVILAMPD